MPNNYEIETLKEEIFNKVKQYYQLKFNNQQEFLPGKTKINYGGRHIN